MSSSSFEVFCARMNERISAIKRLLVVSKRDHDDLVRSLITKMGQELSSCNKILVEMQAQLQKQEKLKDGLKEIEFSVGVQQSEVENVKENIPPHPHKPAQRSNTKTTGKSKEPSKAVEPHSSKQSQEEQQPIKEMPLQVEELDTVPVDTKTTGKSKKPSKAERTKKREQEEIPIKEMPFFSLDEFDTVPVYLRGRLRYGHVNIIIQAINTAVAAKYRIIRQSLKSMEPSEKKLYNRFMEEEIKETRGRFFIVEEDLKEFTELNLDKRFYNVTSILRHSQRLREIRQPGLVRYVIC